MMKNIVIMSKMDVIVSEWTSKINSKKKVKFNQFKNQTFCIYSLRICKFLTEKKLAFFWSGISFQTNLFIPSFSKLASVRFCCGRK